MGEKNCDWYTLLPCVAKFVKSIALQPSERLTVKHNENQKIRLIDIH